MRFRLRTLLIAVLLFSTYLAAYRAAMEPMFYASEGSFGMVVSGHRAPHYKYCEPIARVVFWPIAFVDQKLRPGFWGAFSDLNS